MIVAVSLRPLYLIFDHLLNWIFLLARTSSSKDPLSNSRPNAGDVDELRRQADRGNATADAQLAEFTAEDVSRCRDGLRSSKAPGRNGVVDRAEAPVKVVVGEADVLHECVHTRRPHEAVPLRLQLLRERLRLRSRPG
jgi:hypothetical protein